MPDLHKGNNCLDGANSYMKEQWNNCQYSVVSENLHEEKEYLDFA